jgi:O-antigen/teichoic acid export membrane protein
MIPGERQPSAFGRIRRAVRGSDLGGLASDAGYVAIWQAASAIAQLGQIALITHTLGLYEYGRLSIVIALTVLVSQFFDVRVGVAATTFGAAKLRTDPPAARGVFQLTYLIDGFTGLVAFAVVAGLSWVVGPSLVGAKGGELLLLYALVVLCSTLDQSSISILRLLDRFRLLALCGAALEVLRVALVGVALAIQPGLTAIIMALLIAAAVAALTLAWLAAKAFKRDAHGTSLFAPALGLIREERRAVLHTVFHTNLVSYVRLAQVQLPAVFLGAVAGATQVGLYKVGVAGGSALAKLADPALMAILPRASRLWADGRISDLRRLIRHASYVSVSLAVLGTVLLVGPLATPVLELLGGSQSADDAFWVLVLSAVALGINAAVFWNAAVLFAAGRSRTASLVSVVTGLTQCALLVPLSLSFEAVGAAAALLASMVVGNIVCTVKAWACLREDDRPADSEASGTAVRPAVSAGG